MLPLYDTRMLQVMAYLKEQGIKQKEFCEQIGYPEGNVHKVKRGAISFKTEHIYNTILHYQVNPAYFFHQRAEMFEQVKPLGPRTVSTK